MAKDKDLLFFNKEGDNMNFTYIDTNDRYEGSMIFDENSTDTFKTQCLYTFEKVDGFDYEMQGNLALNKFQLFNEYGFDFYSSNSVTKKQITKIGLVNTSDTFYSKWIYGDDFNKLFPIGTLIRFDSTLLEFTNTDACYCVISAKQGAIMIITTTDNATFDTLYSSLLDKDSTYTDKTISAVNAVGIYHYINQDLSNSLSGWNEQDFYDKIYVNKKLNVIGSTANDGQYTINNISIPDNIFYQYVVDKSEILPLHTSFTITAFNSGDITISINNINYAQQYTSSINNTLLLWMNTYEHILSEDNIDISVNNNTITFTTHASNDTIEIDDSNVSYTKDVSDNIFTLKITMNTDLPCIFNNNIKTEYDSINDKNYINFYHDYAPDILKPYKEFKIKTSDGFSNFYTVAPIPTFINDNTLHNYIEGDLVLYNNKLYQCTTAYTQDFTSDTTAYIEPDNSSFWTASVTHIPVNESVVSEDLHISQIYLTNNILTYTQQYNEVDDVYNKFTDNNATLLYYMSALYADELESLGIELYYENDKLYADLKYPSHYAKIEYFFNDNPIGEEVKLYEKVIGVTESLTTEYNYNFSKRFYKNVVFTDIDDYGIKIKINGQWYNEEAKFVYNGTDISNTRTVDATLRNWLSRHYNALKKLGINTELHHTGNEYSIFYNSISFVNDYPNVDFKFNDIKVGSTANFYIELSSVKFNNLGKYLIITINGTQYQQETSIKTNDNGENIPDIKTTLTKWVSSWASTLEDYHILVSNNNNILHFNTDKTDTVLDYSINICKGTVYAANDYVITDKSYGQLGTLIASNEVVLINSDGTPMSVDDTTETFTKAGITTGMAFSINNTYYTYQNTEFNVDYISDTTINVSYQGAFWGNVANECTNSPYITIAFNNGFSQKNCGNTQSGSTQSGEFDLYQFDTSFRTLYSDDNSYTTLNITLDKYGLIGAKDFYYTSLTNNIFILGKNKILILGSNNCNYEDEIRLENTSDASFIRFNASNNYLYFFKKDFIYIVDPTSTNDYIIDTIDYTSNNITITDAVITSSGDIYISTTNNILVYNQNNVLVKTFNITTADLVYNINEDYVYYVSSTHTITSIDCSTYNTHTIFDFGTTHTIKSEMLYEEVNNTIYVFCDDYLYVIGNDQQPYALTNIPYNGESNMLYNVLTNHIIISDNTNTLRELLITNNTLVYNHNISYHGKMTLNEYDGNIYMIDDTNNIICVINSLNGNVTHIQSIGNTPVHLLYNPDNKGVDVLIATPSTIFQLGVVLNTVITNTTTESVSETGNNNYGTLSDDYKQHGSVWLHIKDFIRRPRENYINHPRVYYYWGWEDDQNPEFFLYDFSGDYLIDSGSYAYVGVKPLNPIVLNDKPNKDLDHVSLPEYQQTIFDHITYSLQYINDTSTYSKPQPLELFVGYQNKVEGYTKSNLMLYKHEVITLTYSSSSTEDNEIYLKNIVVDNGDSTYSYGTLTLATASTYSFYDTDLKVGQLISLYLYDITNYKNKYISPNNGIVVKIKSIYYKTIDVDYIDTEFYDENTTVADYPSENSTTYLRLVINVEDKNIAKITLYGQTEEEDIRFKTELSNTGKLIDPREVFIFKDYDILEGGIDFTFLNRKRKELLITRSQIFPFVGSYKAIINAINYFGYNDLELYEYFRCIDITSDNYLQLYKELIPDIFDNSVEGFSESDFVMNNYPNPNYENTNLFNLTYNITDKDGNITLKYTLDEVIIKLQGLKYWLQKHIIPITHKIKDIVGQTYLNENYQISNENYDVTILNIHENMTPITFKMNEAYLLPINSGSTVYNCVLDFYAIIDGVGADKSHNGLIDLNDIPTAFNGVSVSLPQYFNIDIKTYKTYNEWTPYTNYDKGDKVYYNSKIYESVVDGENKAISPERYKDIKEWNNTSVYHFTDTIKYNNDIYTFISHIDAVTISPYIYPTPYVDTEHWLNITYWKEVSYETVQSYKDFRVIPHPTGLTYSNKILPFNFTIDTNIDPFISITVTSDNGYGAIYSDKKNYELRSPKSLNATVRYIDPLGPFIPVPLY